MFNRNITEGCTPVPKLSLARVKGNLFTPTLGQHLAACVCLRDHPGTTDPISPLCWEIVNSRLILEVKTAVAPEATIKMQNGNWELAPISTTP